VSDAAESSWISAHAFYRDDLDRLVVDAVVPLVEKLTTDGVIGSWFFLRYWEGGTHIRLRVLPAEEEKRSGAVGLISESFSEYFRQRPAASSMTEAAYAEFARKAMRRDPEYSTTLFPNNSVSFIPYRREYHAYGTGPAMAAVERHFAESSRIAIRALTSGALPDRRIIAGAAMIALAWCCAESDPDKQLALMATRRGSTKIDEISDRPEPPASNGRAANNVDVADDEWRNLVRRMRSLTATVARTRANGTLIDWARSMAVLRTSLNDDAANSARAVPGHAADSAVDTAASQGRERTFAVLDDCAHLVCNRLGITIGVEAEIRQRLATAVGGLAGSQVGTAP
jgi:thiopeptide-type bacteriocin biosynthesis protein